MDQREQWRGGGVFPCGKVWDPGSWGAENCMLYHCHILMERTWIVHDRNIISSPSVPTLGMYSFIMLYLPLGIIGHCSCVDFGSKPRPMNATLSSSLIVLTWYRWLLTSSQVWCRLDKGAPLSSNWPPGSRVTLWPSFLQPMILSPSIIGFHPNRETSCCSTFSMSR